MPEIKALFLMLLGDLERQGFGEIVTALALADRVVEDGGEVWCLASPLAARIAKPKFPGRVFDMSLQDLSGNQATWRNAIAAVKPNVIVFSELNELMFPVAYQGCPLIDFRWLEEVERLDGVLVWTDLMGFTPLVQKAPARMPAAPRFLRSFLERMSVLLPCPLHDPSPVNGRPGIRYRHITLPLVMDPAERKRMRAQYLGDSREDDGLLIVHATGSWIRELVERRSLPLYAHLGELLAAYLADLPKRVKIFDISDRPFSKPSVVGNCEMVPIRSMPPAEFDRLMLSSDLVLTENAGGYTLGKTLGSVPAMVLMNSYTLDEILAREGDGSPVRRIVRSQEQKKPNSIYPHLTYPFRSTGRLLGKGVDTSDNLGPLSPAPDVWSMLDAMAESGLGSLPILRAELYGGDETRDLFRRVLCDPETRFAVRQKQMDYIERQSSLEDGPAALKRLLSGGAVGHTLLEGSTAR